MLASPSQAAVLKSFLGMICSVNYTRMWLRFCGSSLLLFFGDGHGLPFFSYWRISVCLTDSNVHLQPRQPTVSWTALKKTWQTGLGRWFSPSTLLLWDPAWNTESICGHTSKIRTWACCHFFLPRGGKLRWSKGWIASSVKTGWESSGCSARWRGVSAETLMQSSSM